MKRIALEKALASDNQLTPLVETLLMAAKARGMTQGALAHAAGVSPETLSRIKHRDNVEFAVLSTLAQAVGMKLTLVPDNERQEKLRKRQLITFEAIDYGN